MKITFTKKEKGFQKKSFIFNVNLYWKIIVLFTFVFSLLFFFFSYQLFVEINKEATVPVSDISAQNNLVTKERIDKTLDYFSSREQKSNQILYSSSPVVDPSL